MKDLGKIGFPFQVAGAVIYVLGLILHDWPLVYAGEIAHLVGDTLFFFQMKRQGCL